MQSTTDKKKVKKIFKTKKSSITCSKLMINELARKLAHCLSQSFFKALAKNFC